MLYPVKGSGGTTLMPLETRLLGNRMVFIHGTIDDTLASDFIQQIALLNLEDPISPIDVLFNTPGGEIQAGLLMYTAIQGSRAPVRTVCLEKAYSMGAILFASGRHGRLMLPHSELMIHEPRIFSSLGGSSSSIQSDLENLMRYKELLNGILARHTGRTIEEIEQATRTDHFLNPQESVDFGLCDEIAGFDRLIGG